MNECTNIKSKYFKENVFLATPDKERIRDYQNILLNIKQYGDKNKGPDLISKIDNKIYGIEHFEFDSTKSSKRKGSSYRQQLANIDHIVDKEIKKSNKVKKISAIILNQNLEDYVNNFTRYFKQHYSRINSYLEYLNLDYPNFEKEIWFFIEDITLLGNTYIDNNDKQKLFNPMLSLSIINLLEESSKLKGIIVATESILYVYPNTEKQITILKEICKSENVKSLLIQNPICVTTLTKQEIKD